VDVPVPPAQMRHRGADQFGQSDESRESRLRGQRRGRRLNIFDVTNPSSPVLAGSFSDTTNLNSVEAVRVHGNYAFCVTENQASLTVIGSSNPAAPIVKATFRGPTPGTSLAGATNIRLNAAGTIAFVTTRSPEIRRR
jgi:hypothetical protein